MKTQKSASLEAKIKNSKDLIIIIKDLALYDPTSEKLKIANYESFVNEVNESITPLRIAKGYLDDAKKQARHAFKDLEKVCKNIQSEVDEMRSASSDEYAQVRNIVKLITGVNVVEHAKMKKKILAGLKEGEIPPKFSSVSQLDYKSKLGNFRALLGILTTFGFYNPSDSSISKEALALLEDLDALVGRMSKRRLAALFSALGAEVVVKFDALQQKSRTLHKPKSGVLRLGRGNNFTLPVPVDILSTLDSIPSGTVKVKPSGRQKSKNQAAPTGQDRLLGKDGRGERIRTSGIHVPNVALYQAELRPDIFSDSGLRNVPVISRAANDAKLLKHRWPDTIRVEAVSPCRGAAACPAWFRPS